MRNIFLQRNQSYIKVVGSDLNPSKFENMGANRDPPRDKKDDNTDEEEMRG